MNAPEALDPYFCELEAEDAFSGVVLITQGNKTLYSGAFGYASRAWGIRNTLDIRFDTASITKLFTTAAILRLIDKQVLALDTRVTQYLGLQGTKISDDVNVFHLLTHTSGIGDDCEEEDGENYEDLWKTKPNYSVIHTEDFLPQFAYKEPNFAPGQGCRYCNCGFVLLGLMIEKATGASYRDHIQEHIFERAGMSHSGFFDMGQVNALVAEGCDPIKDAVGKITGWKKNIYSYPPIGSPDGGAHVTAADLDRFLRVVQRGELLSQELTAEFFSPHVDYKQKGSWAMKYGYCLWFHVEKDGKVLYCQKEGVNAGASGILRYYPGQDINVVILSNMEEGAWEPARKIHELVIAGESAHGPRHLHPGKCDAESTDLRGREL